MNLQFAPEVRPDISKSFLSKSRLHKLHAFMKKILETEICIKFESEAISITGDYRSKSDSKEEDQEKGTVVQSIRKAIDCQQGEAKRSYCGFVTFVII